MLTGVHILLTYKCTSECDHCFLHCSPAREGTFTLAQLQLADLFARYDPGAHPIVGPLLRGGPARLAKEHALPLSGGYVDECHLCYAARKVLLPAFPAYLCPKEVYGV